MDVVNDYFNSSLWGCPNVPLANTLNARIVLGVADSLFVTAWASVDGNIIISPIFGVYGIALELNKLFSVKRMSIAEGNILLSGFLNIICPDVDVVSI